MFVDTGLLHSGATESRRAGGHARDGADRLSRGPLLSGMFGDFAGAEVFQEAVSGAHARHVAGLQAHAEAVTVIGRKAERAAAEFTDMDDSGATDSQAVQCISDT
jgi:hypothetical protein